MKKDKIMVKTLKETCHFCVFKAVKTVMLKEGKTALCGFCLTVLAWSINLNPQDNDGLVEEMWDRFQERQEMKH